jgi:mRNA interferase MazF
VTPGARCPDRGEIVWIDFSPQARREQAGRRPGFVVSPRLYNKPSGFALFCPITSSSKGYPYEVALPLGLPIQGVVLSDQARSLDWRARRVRLACRASDDVTAAVLSKLGTLVQ